MSSYLNDQAHLTIGAGPLREDDELWPLVDLVLCAPDDLLHRVLTGVRVLPGEKMAKDVHYRH